MGFTRMLFSPGRRVLLRGLRLLAPEAALPHLFGLAEPRAGRAPPVEELRAARVQSAVPRVPNGELYVLVLASTHANV